MDRKQRELFKYRLDELHRETGISRKQAATDLGMHYNTYGNYFHGTTPTLDNLAAIANYFNTTVDYLVGRTEEK